MKKFLLPSFLLLVLTLVTGLVFGQAPTISYTSPNTYLTGAAMSLAPTSSGVTGGYATVTLLNTNANRPLGVTTDPTGISYAIDNNSTNIYRITAAGVRTTMTLPTNPFSQPTAIGIDGNGSLFVADFNRGLVYKFTIAGTTATLAATIGTNTLGNIFEPVALAFDASNNIYVADQQNNGATGVVFKISATTLAVSSYITGMTLPTGVAVDPSGNTYVSESTANTVVKVTSLGVQTTVTGTFNNPQNLTSDASGNIYEADRGSASIQEISAAGVTSTMISTGLTTPVQVSFDSAKNLYEADDSGTDAINKSTPTTLYSINAAPALPTGITFSAATGTFSGTPTTITVPRTYTVTAYNSSGSTSTTVTIIINAAGAPTIVYSPTSNTYTQNVTITSWTPTVTGAPAPVITITPTLPAGLAISAATGAITGKPTVASVTTTYTVTATNSHGNAIATLIITVNPAAPALLYNVTNVFATGSTVTLTPTNSGGTPASSTPSVALPTGLSISATGVISGVPTVVTPATSYTVSSTNVTNTTTSNTFTIQIADAPAFSYVNTPYTEDIGYTFAVAPTVTAGSPTGYSFTGAAPPGSTFSTTTGTFSGPATGVAGTNYNMVVTATNAVGLTSTANVRIKITAAQAFTYTGPNTYIVGSGAITPLTPSLTITNATISPALPTGLSISAAGAISGSPTAVAATTVYTITATTANGGTNSATVTITVNAPAPPNLSYTGTPYTFTNGISNTTVTITNGSGGGAVTSTYTLNITSGALPAGITFNSANGTFTVVPTAAGTFTGTVTASNLGGPSSAAITMTVNNPAAPTSIAYLSPAPDYTYAQNTAITATTPTVVGTVPATGAFSIENMTTLATSTTTVPGITGLVFNANTGQISGTPTVTQAITSYTVTVTNAGGSATTTFNITVNIQAPIISYVPSSYSFATGVGGVTSAASNAGGTATYSVDPTSPAFPSYLSIDPTTGIITASSAAVSTAATAYIIDGTNISGTSHATVTIAIVGPPILSYTPSSYTVTYGTAINATIANAGDPVTSTYTVTSGTLPTGLTLNAATGAITGVPNVTTATTVTVNASNAAGSSASPATITFTVNPATLTITAVNKTKTYGAANPALTVSYVGFVNGDTNASLTTQPTVSTTATTASPVATYPITATGAVDNNYTISYAAGTLTVNPVLLTIKASNQTKPYGATFTFVGNEYTITTGALVTGDAITGITFTSAGAASTATVAGSPYTIVPSAAVGTGLSNYTITYANGTMTVSKLVITISATGPSKTYGTALASGTYTTNFSVTTGTLAPGDAITSVLLTMNGNAQSTTRAAGLGYTVTPSAQAGLTAGNYTITYAAFAGTVAPAPLTVIASTNNKPYGTTLNNGNITTGFTYPTIQNGETIGRVTAAYGTGAAATATVGTYSGQVTISGAAGGTFTASNYTITYVAGDIVVGQATLTITANSVTKTFGATLTSGPGSTAFTATGLASGETVGSVTITYGTGAAAGDPVATYTNSVVPSAATGGTFNPANYTIVYNDGNIVVNPQPPVLSYTNPSPYTVGTAIGPLSPTNTGGAVATTGTYISSQILTSGNGLIGPYGMAVDASGNIYVTNFTSNTITEYSTGGVVTSTSLPAGSGPVGLVFDASGNAYVLDQTLNKIVKYTGGLSGTASNFETGLNFPTGIAIDASGNIYIANTGNNRIFKYAPAGGAATLTITANALLSVDDGIAVDASGNIYVADDNNFFFGPLVDIYNSAGTYTASITGFGNVGGLYIDSSGKVYVNDNGAGTATVYTTGLGSTIVTETGFNDPEGIVSDASGNFYVADFNNNTVTKYAPAKGYVLTGTLPPGINFDTTTGTFSGTPETVFGPTTLTVTGYNAGGPGSTTVTLSCGANPPVISYTPATNVYPVGAAITPLGPPANAGGAIAPAGFNAGTSFATGINQPWGLTTDASGNIWVAQNNAARVTKYTPAGVATNFPVAATGNTGVAVDASGNFYVSNTNGRIYKYSPAGALLNTNTTVNGFDLGLGTLDGIAVDASGNLYAADNTNGIIWKYTASTATTAPLFFTTTPVGVAVDPAGDIYVVDQGTSKALTEYSSAGVYSRTIASGYTTAYSIYVDAKGDYYVGDAGTNTIKEYNALGTLICSLSATNPRGITTDATGNLYASNFTAGTITKYPPFYYVLSGGTLPTGLAFNTTTGTFTGTPTVTFPTTTFTITAFGSDGGPGPTTVTITCAYAPSFTYTTPQVYPIGVGIPTLSPIFAIPNGGGPLTSATVTTNGPLPAGLTLNPDGTITGTPTAVSGPITYTITGTNAAGLTGTATVTITCTYAPSFSYTSPQIYQVGAAIATLSPIFAIPNGGGPLTSAAVTTNGPLPAGLTLNADGTITGTPTAASPMTTYTITGTNAAGLTGTATVTITCVYGPNFTYTSPQTYTDGTPIPTLSPIFSIPNGGGPLTSATVTTNGPLPPGLTLNADGTITGTPTTVNGPITYTITGTNSYGFTGTATVTITCNPSLPIISYTTPDVYNVGIAIAPPLTPANTGGAVASWSISPGLPPGINFDTTTGIISGTPTAVSPAINYTVTATNVTGSATCVVNISVQTDAPVITYTTPDVYNVGAIITPLVPGNTGGAVATWSISPGLPAGLTFDTTTGIITGTPTTPSAAANYTVTATNSGGSGMFVINITVNVGGPVLTYTTPDIFPDGIAITPLSPANTGTTPTGYSISPGLPAGLNFDTTTGIISGTPAGPSPAATYTVTATDGTNTGSFNISIACVTGNDWLGGTSIDWTDGTNWSAGTVPTATDAAFIGVNVPYSNFPTLLAGAGVINVGSVIIGSDSGLAGGVLVNTGSTLNVAATITYQSDAFATLPYTASLSGAGTINASGINVTANTALASSYTQTMASSVTNLNIATNVTLTSGNSGANLYNAIFNVTGGTTLISGTIQTSNTATSTSTLNVTSATLQLASASALAGLSGIGANVISFNNPGAIIEYSGAGQTYYTDAAINGLPGGESYNSITFSGSGVKSPNGTNTNNLLIGGDFTNALTTNDASNYIDLSAPTVNFNGVTQNILAGNGTGTKFYNLIFSGTGTTTIQSGSASVASTGVLTMSGSSAILAAGGLLTLNSDINGTASVAAIPAGCSITGNVNAQRFITGGGLNYRGYRLVSSPVYGSNNLGTGGVSNIYSINYLINSVYLKGQAAVPGGWDAGGNPNVYLFRENLASSNAGFSVGNFRSINTLGFAPNFNYLIDNDPGTFNIPVGDGYMFFFRGDRNVASLTAETTVSYVPTNTVLTATGTLNQGPVTVSDWYTPGSANLGWTTTAGNGSVQGFNLVGNPYASSIDWDKLDSVLTTTGIYTQHVNPFIYIIDPVNNNYNVYKTGMGGVGTINTTGSNIIPSGQGFFVRAGSASAQLVFSEAAKVTAQANAANGNLLMGHPPLAAALATSQYLHLKILKDTTGVDGIIISFGSNTSNKYNPSEDAVYRNGNGSVSLTSMSADNVPLAINSMPLPAQTTQTVIPLSVNASTDGTAQIQMAEVKSIPALFTIWLKDAYRKDSLDVRANTTYTFDILHSDTNSFGAHRFSLVMGENPALMIHLLSFSASKIQTGDQVVWTTENEQNYTNFTVERSTDGTTFNALGGFLSNAQSTYSYLDKTPVTGANMYRLKIVDINGTISYSNVVTIMYANTNGQIAINGMMVYPNPTAGKINLSITSSQANGTTGGTTTAKPSYNIEIVNNLGTVIKSAQSNSPLWQSDVTALTPGTYFIRVINTSNNTVVGKSAFVKL